MHFLTFEKNKSRFHIKVTKCAIIIIFQKNNRFKSFFKNRIKLCFRNKSVHYS